MRIPSRRIFARRALALAVVLAWGAGVAQAAAQVRSPLADLPSRPGPFQSLLENLPAGLWLDLGKPAPDPRWGRARGRVWNTNMPYAPSLGGAFLYGEGVHGWWNRENGRYMDDLWFYDGLAHRWINVHPGTDVRNEPELAINGDGVLTDKDGNPMPIAQLGHGYRMTEWDPESRRFFAMSAPAEYFKSALPRYAAFIQSMSGRLNSSRISPWMYDVSKARWLRFATKTPSPKSGYGDALVHVPEMGGMFYYEGGTRGAWLYRIRDNLWTKLNPRGPLPPFTIDPTACYDPKRSRIYVGGGGYPTVESGNALWIYDVKQRSWIDPKPSGNPGGNGYSTNIAMMHCDTAADQVLVFRYAGTKRGIFAYDPQTNAWQTAASGLPQAWPDDHQAAGSSGYYDARRNLHLFHVAGDSQDNGVILVYRHGKRGAARR